jgi:hypothetical protein
MVDERPPRFRFLLSGSSARKLRRGRANLLRSAMLGGYSRMLDLVAASSGIGATQAPL